MPLSLHSLSPWSCPRLKICPASVSISARDPTPDSVSAPNPALVSASALVLLQAQFLPQSCTNLRPCPVSDLYTDPAPVSDSAPDTATVPVSSPGPALVSVPAPDLAPGSKSAHNPASVSLSLSYPSLSLCPWSQSSLSLHHESNPVSFLSQILLQSKSHDLSFSTCSFQVFFF